jgi:hypothetical protein
MQMHASHNCSVWRSLSKVSGGILYRWKMHDGQCAQALPLSTTRCEKGQKPPASSFVGTLADKNRIDEPFSYFW